MWNRLSTEVLYNFLLRKMRRANNGYHCVYAAYGQWRIREKLEIQERRKMELQEKKKPLLLKELQSKLKKLDEIDDDNFKEGKDPYLNDQILEELQRLSQDAAKHELKEIQKLCKLAIGKRILNVELKKKKNEHNKKIKNREKNELFFRQNRIKRYNYEDLIQEKLKESTLIARAYQNGKGFIESTARYKEEYERQLIQCDFLGVIKRVNGMFYKNYSSLSKGNKSLSDKLLSFLWVPIAIFVILAITLPFISFKNQEIILMCLLGLILVVLFFVSARTFLDKPSNNNYIQETVSEVEAYFQEINQKSLQKGRNVEWRCSKDFMYLQVEFHGGFSE